MQVADLKHASRAFPICSSNLNISFPVHLDPMYIFWSSCSQSFLFKDYFVFGIFSLFSSINLFDASPVWWDVKWTDGQLKTFQSTFSRFQSNLDTSYKQAHPNKTSENFLQNFCNDDMFFRSDQSIGYLELSWISQIIIIYGICLTANSLKTSKKFLWWLPVCNCK